MLESQRDTHTKSDGFAKIQLFLLWNNGLIQIWIFIVFWHCVGRTRNMKNEWKKNDARPCAWVVRRRWDTEWCACNHVFIIIIVFVCGRYGAWSVRRLWHSARFMCIACEAWKLTPAHSTRTAENLQTTERTRLAPHIHVIASRDHFFRSKWKMKNPTDSFHLKLRSICHLRGYINFPWFTFYAFTS